VHFHLWGGSGGSDGGGGEVGQQGCAAPDILPVAGALRWLDASIDGYCRDMMEAHDAPRWADVVRIAEEGLEADGAGPQQLVAIPLVLQGQPVGAVSVVCPAGVWGEEAAEDGLAIARLAEAQLLKISHAAQVMRSAADDQMESRPRTPDGHRPDLDLRGLSVLRAHRVVPGLRLLHAGRRIPLLGPLALLVHAVCTLADSADMLRSDLVRTPSCAPLMLPLRLARGVEPTWTACLGLVPCAAASVHRTRPSDTPAAALWGRSGASGRWWSMWTAWSLWDSGGRCRCGDLRFRGLRFRVQV